MHGAIDDGARGGRECDVVGDGRVVEPGVGQKGVHVEARCAGLGSRG